MEIVRTMVLDSSDSLSKALAELDETPAVLVTRNGAYLGIIDHRCLSQGIRDPRKVKCETVIAKPPVLNEAASVDDRVDAFLLGHFKALPVVDSEKRPLGITTRVELLKEMVVDSRIPAMQADEIMSSPVFTIDEGDTIASAKRILREKGAHRLAVTRKGKLIGVVSTFDIGAWSSKTNMPGGRKDIRLSESLSTDAMPISSFLRPDVSLVKAGASLEESARRMIDKQVSAVIVVSDGKPLGVISALDIFRKVKEAGDEGLQIQVSGLKRDDAAYFTRIYVKIGNALEKFSRTFNIRNTNVHVKSGKSTYVVAVNFDTDKGHVSLKTERGTLKEGIDELAVEVHDILRKKKELRRQKPRRTHAH